MIDLEEKERKLKFMNLKKFFLSVIVGSSLILLFCCAGNKKMAVKQKNEVNYIPYYLKVYEADSLYWVNNYELSYEILDTLFRQYKPINLLDEVNQYLVSGYKIKEYNGKDKYIELLFKEWGFIQEDFGNYPEIDSLCRELNISNMLDDWENYYLTHNVNYELREQIDTLVALDQHYRKKENRNLSKLDSIDKLIEPLIIKILEKYGYPNRRIGLGIVRLKGGDYQFLEIHTMLNHTTDALREDYLFEKLLNEVKRGNMLPEYYGSIVDQYHVYNDDPQLFGTMFKTYPNELSKLKYNLIETKKIRKEYGLYPNPFYQVWRNEQIDKKFNH